MDKEKFFVGSDKSYNELKEKYSDIYIKCNNIGESQMFEIGHDTALNEVRRKMYELGLHAICDLIIEDC